MCVCVCVDSFVGFCVSVCASASLRLQGCVRAQTFDV